MIVKQVGFHCCFHYSKKILKSKSDLTPYFFLLNLCNMELKGV